MTARGFENLPIEELREKLVQLHNDIGHQFIEQNGSNDMSGLGDKLVNIQFTSEQLSLVYQIMQHQLEGCNTVILQKGMSKRPCRSAPAEGVH